MKKNTPLIIILCLFIFLNVGCKKDEVKTNTVDFTYTYENPNSVKFTALITGYYDKTEWVINGKSTIYATTITQSFPLKGTYNVTLLLWIGNTSNSITKQITIDQDKPESPLTWTAEFDGTGLNTTIWTVETDIHVNNELQQYTASGNYSILNGVLTILCKKLNNAGVYGSYTSARLKTQVKKSFKYGRIEARMKLPKGKGTWPAFWMLGESIGTGIIWPNCGEIDIMEYVGYDPYWVQGSLHSSNFFAVNSKNGRYQLPTDNDEAQWHTYGLTWNADVISFYVDDVTKPYYSYSAPSVKTAENWPYDKNFFIILNLAFGGSWGGAKGIDTTLDNMALQVDWIRFYAD